MTRIKLKSLCKRLSWEAPENVPAEAGGLNFPEFQAARWPGMGYPLRLAEISKEPKGNREKTTTFGEA